MEPSRVDRTLEEWKSVASQARPPAAPPRRVALRSGLSTSTLAGASLAAGALVIAFLWLGGRGPDGTVGASPSPDPVTTPPPTASPIATMGSCDPANLSAVITMWEGAAGHRIATIELTNAGSDGCILPTLARPQLLDGRGAILIDGSSPSSSEPLTVEPGDVLTTLVQDGNYCGPAPVAPVTVAFDLGDGTRIVAAPVSATDATVPPCLGSGTPATIEMQPWSAQRGA